MKPSQGVSAIFRPVLYRNPYPLFVWGGIPSQTGGEEMAGEEPNIWTAASLYWALVELDRQGHEPVLASRPRVAAQPRYADFPKLIRDSALGGVFPSLPTAIGASRPGTVLFEGELTGEHVALLPALILLTQAREYHFVRKAAAEPFLFEYGPCVIFSGSQFRILGGIDEYRQQVS